MEVYIFVLQEVTWRRLECIENRTGIIAATHLSVTDVEEIMRLHVLYEEKHMVIYIRIQEEHITLVKYGIAS